MRSPHHAPSRRRGLGLAVVCVALAAACGGAGSATEDGAESSEPATTLPRVAATSLAAGDCVDGIVVGLAERASIESAQLADCGGAHDIEVFASFTITGEGEYPGVQRVVDEADAGCTDQLGAVTVEPDLYGLLTFWPTEDSWVDGDRLVLCAAFPTDGSGFSQPTLVG